ncbi:MAG: hypothetical protein H7Z43_00500 [Clostridia bacterium]|nr:hypothetical protein [Deltaproteobacteria bacterium]
MIADVGAVMAGVRLENDGATIIVRSERGAMRLRLLSRTVIEIAVLGIGDGILVAPALEHARPWLFDAGKATVFIDLSEMTAHDTDFRKEWTHWLLNTVGDLLGVHVLGDPRAVYAAVPASSVVLSDLVRQTRDRVAFDSIKREAVWNG